MFFRSLLCFTVSLTEFFVRYARIPRRSVIDCAAMVSDQPDKWLHIAPKAESIAKLRAHQEAARENAARRAAAALPTDEVPAAGRDGTGMTCFLCAYTSTALPNQSHPLPAATPAGPHDVLACCATCGVCACAGHGSRYSQFQCALCSWAAVVHDATASAPVGVPATALAHSVGRGAAATLVRRVTTAMRRVTTASRTRPQTVNSISLVAPLQGDPNLVTNLADSIRAQQSVSALIAPEADAGDIGYGGVDLDAIAAAVRARFGGRELAGPTDDSAIAVTGALLLGYSLADADIARRQADNPADWAGDVANLPAPWLVTYPTLLDPALWMVGTALQEG